MNYTEKDFDGSARSGPDTVDITGYYAKMKLVFGLMGTAVTLTFAFGIWQNPTILEQITAYYGHGYLWGENGYGARSYASCLQGRNSDLGCHAGMTPGEFAWQMFRRNPDDRVTDLMLLSISILPLILFCTLRRPRPVRFNRELGAIYGWRWGRLFIRPSRYFKFKLNTFYDGLQMSDDYGEAIIRLRDSRNPERRGKFKLGPYPARQPGQPSRLLMQMPGFLQGTEAPDVHAQRPTKIRCPWWQRSLLGPKKLPDNIDQIARDWMREHGNESGSLTAD